METPIDPLHQEYAKIDLEAARQIRWTLRFPRLRTALLLLWSAVDLLLVFGSLGVLTWYLVQGSFTEKALLARLSDNIESAHTVTGQNVAQGLIVSNTQILNGAAGHVDFYATVSNPNKQWYATYTYYFKTASGNTPIADGYSLPGQEAVVASLGQDLKPRPGTGDLQLENITWHRITFAPNGDVPAWLATRQQFTISEISHGAVANIGDASVIQTSFKIKNESAYSYWDTDVYVVLKVGRNVVGVNKVRIPAFDAGQEFPETVSWFGGTSVAATATILPQINFFDKNAYKVNPTL